MLIVIHESTALTCYSNLESFFIFLYLFIYLFIYFFVIVIIIIYWAPV